jgi:hypothetical protein
VLAGLVVNYKPAERPIDDRTPFDGMGDNRLREILAVLNRAMDERGMGNISAKPLTAEEWEARYAEPAPVHKPLLPAAPQANGHEPKLAAVNPEPKAAPSPQILPPRPRRRRLQ